MSSRSTFERLKEIWVAYINEHYGVEGLCRGFPKRVRMVVAAEGDRIKKRSIYVYAKRESVPYAWLRSVKMDGDSMGIR